LKSQKHYRKTGDEIFMKVRIETEQMLLEELDDTQEKEANDYIVKRLVK
jgi:hypothetical protein